MLLNMLNIYFPWGQQVGHSMSIVNKNTDKINKRGYYFFKQKT